MRCFRVFLIKNQKSLHPSSLKKMRAERCKDFQPGLQPIVWHERFSEEGLVNDCSIGEVPFFRFPIPEEVLAKALARIRAIFLF